MARGLKTARRMPKPDPKDVARAAELQEGSGGGFGSAAARLVHEGMTLGASKRSADEPEDPAQQALFRDIDVILGRLEAGISAERAAMNALLERLADVAG